MPLLAAQTRLTAENVTLVIQIVHICTAADLSALDRTGTSAAILALIAPSAPVTTVTTVTTTQTGGWHHLEVHLGSSSISFRISNGGYIDKS